MRYIPTRLDRVYILEPTIHRDNRGWFLESFSQKMFNKLGLDCTFVQDNHSYSRQKGILRGLHFQNSPMAQTKLVRCTRGAILDVAVDLRKGSPTYLEWISVELTAENHKQLLIPKGFAHGFLTLTEDTEVQYKVDQYYSPELDRSIRYDDPDIRIDWGYTDPILSEKDQNAPFVAQSDCNFIY